jgi:hypothetical protein
MKVAEPPARHGQVKWLIGRLGDGHAFRSAGERFTEIAQFREAEDQIHSGEHRWADRHAETLVEQVAAQGFNVPRKELDRPVVRAKSVVRVAEVVIRRDSEREVPERVGDGQGPGSVCERVFRVGRLPQAEGDVGAQHAQPRLIV